MSRSPTSRIAGALKSSSYTSETQDRLAARVSVEEQQATLEREVAKEMAEALGRAETRVLTALAKVEAAGLEIDAAIDDATRKEKVEAYNLLRRTALDARLDLQIQREAIGIRRNDRLELLYPVPPKRA